MAYLYVQHPPCHLNILSIILFFSSVVGRTFVASAALPWLGFGPPYCAVSECLPACFQAGGHTSCAPAWMSRCLVSCMWVQSVAGHVVNMVH